MRVHHLALAVTDLGAAEAFYVGVLGLVVTARSGRSLWIDLDGVILMLELEAAPLARASTPCLALAIAAPERAEWQARLGDRVESETAYTLYLRDPDGNRIGCLTTPW